MEVQIENKEGNEFNPFASSVFGLGQEFASFCACPVAVKYHERISNSAGTKYSSYQMLVKGHVQLFVNSSKIRMNTDSDFWSTAYVTFAFDIDLYKIIAIWKSFGLYLNALIEVIGILDSSSKSKDYCIWFGMQYIEQ